MTETVFPAGNVWLRMYPCAHDADPAADVPADECVCDELAEAEANIFRDESGDIYVGWYLNDVGLVTRVYFNSVEDAEVWLIAEGFQDFSS